MASTFPLELVTPEKLLFSEEIRMVRAPGALGSFGVLAHHAPMLAELQIGMIKVIRADGSEELMATSGGFLQVSRDKVIILADTAELSTEIDIARAELALDRARQMLSIPGELSAEEVKQMMERAHNRIHVAQLGNSQ